MIAAIVSAFVLSSPAFYAGGLMPDRYTCTGANVSPPLRWTAPPKGTRSFSLTVVDIDAPGGSGFVHWRASGIPASARSLAAGAHPPVERANTFGRVGYSGPCPPPGAAHRYVFTLRAVNAGGKILAQARLVGRYAR